MISVPQLLAKLSPELVRSKERTWCLLRKALSDVFFLFMLTYLAIAAFVTTKRKLMGRPIENTSYWRSTRWTSKILELNF